MAEVTAHPFSRRPQPWAALRSGPQDLYFYVATWLHWQKGGDKED